MSPQPRWKVASVAYNGGVELQSNGQPASRAYLAKIFWLYEIYRQTVDDGLNYISESKFLAVLQSCCPLLPIPKKFLGDSSVKS